MILEEITEIIPANGYVAEFKYISADKKKINIWYCHIVAWGKRKTQNIDLRTEVEWLPLYHEQECGLVIAYSPQSKVIRLNIFLRIKMFFHKVY